MRFHSFFIINFFILVFSFVAQNTFGQYNIPKIIPPSPNASSLGKYGDIPVGLYTGIPNVNIPLYTINVGDFSLPISLSYHSQGLKVEEKAGWVGLGWTLNAGGAVTRSVCGLADELGGFWTHPNWTDATVASLGVNSPSFFAGTAYDQQPDMFYYNFGNYSGKFVMDQTTSHTAHFIPFADLKTSYHLSLGNISQFQIIDESGIIYKFSTVEATTADNGGSIDHFNSAWYLTQITTPGGEINFIYTSETTNSVQFSETNFLNVNGGGDENQFNPGYTSSYRYLSNSSCILSSISFPSGKITFNITGNRKDFGSASAITGMTVYDQNNKPQHKFSFIESYFGNTTLNVPEKVRLKLDSVVELAVDGSNSRKVYGFTYFNPSNVPSILSLAQDSWGFYNGHTENNSLLPYIDPIVYGPYIANQAASKHGNRDPVAGSAQIGVLQTIKYPTGGTTEFVYEGNDFANENGYRTKEYLKSKKTATARTVNLTGQTTPFSINSDQTVTLYINGSYSGPAPQENGPTVILNKINTNGTRTNIYAQYMINSTSYQYPELTVGDYEVIASVDGSNQNALGTISYFYTDTTTVIHKFSTGGLRISKITNTDSVSGNQNTKKFLYTSMEDTLLSSGNLFTVPIYLEKLSSYTFPSSYYIETSNSLAYLGTSQGSHVAYNTVTEINESAISNGKKVSFFNANDFHDASASVHYVLDGSGNYYFAGSNTVARYKTDYSVYRGFLTKEFVYNSSNQIMKKTYYYYNSSFSEPTSEDNYFKLNAIAGYSYNICHTGCGQCRCPIGSTCPACTNYALDNYTWNDFSIICPWIHKTYTIDTSYDITGTNFIRDSTAYFYGNSNHGLVTKIVKTNSEGEILITNTKYPLDYTITGAPNTDIAKGIQNLQNLHIINPIIEQYVQRSTTDGSNSRTISGSFNVYKPTTPYPEVNYRLETPSPLTNYQAASITASTATYDSRYKPQLYFDNYDTYGNILQQHKVNDVNHSYIWGYNNTYPIAEAVNASSTDIAYTSFEENGKGNWNNYAGPITTATTDATMPPTGTKYYNLTTTNTLSKPVTNGKKYIISYWNKSASAYTISGGTGTAKTGRAYNGWTYHEHLMTAASTTLTISGTGVIDEVRLYPSDAQMTTYTYQPLVGMTSKSDANNRITYYAYDGFGRLSSVKDQDGNIIKTYCYNYAGQLTDCRTPFQNIAQSKTFIKNDCTDTALCGAEVEATVAMGAFTSDSSQEEADSLAKAYLDSTGQAYANTNGECLSPMNILMDNYEHVAGFTIQLTSVYDSTKVYTISFPEDADSSVSLQKIPQGHYNIVLSKADNAQSFLFTVSGPAGEIQVNSNKGAWNNVPVNLNTFYRVAIGILNQ